MDILNLSKLIQEVGIAAVVGASFIYISILNSRKFNAIFDRILKQNESTLKEVISMLKDTKEDVEHIGESMSGDKYPKISVTLYFAFKWSELEILNLIDGVKKENSIDDIEQIQSKIRLILQNLYNERDEKLSIYVYNGKKIGEYIDTEIIEVIFSFCLKSVLDKKPFDMQYYMNQLNSIYKEVELNTLKRIKNG